ncbi:hypothetical protein J2793_006453 [Paraburkholderia caledonica]|uniref:Amidohydrolase-related domain-containing protein n=1 Tax=Paraburkholderia caledonica TaxID=134536 RepID=A0AB73ILU2_9BURK|nr:hypothetical protein [Paraburkholderia caledonica]
MACATKIGINPHALQRAAQYFRMSTDHQEYSPRFQRETIAEYARAHNFRVVCHATKWGIETVAKEIRSFGSDFVIVEPGARAPPSGSASIVRNRCPRTTPRLLAISGARLTMATSNFHVPQR